MAAQKEFMLRFNKGQEYLITAKKLRWVYQHGLINAKYAKDVDRELSCAQFEAIHNNPDNGYYSFYYNDVLLKQVSINRTARHPHLIVLTINDPFPGYAPGHTAYNSTPYDARGIKNSGIEINREFHEALGLKAEEKLNSHVRGEDQQRGDTPEGAPSHRNDTGEVERSDHHYQQPHPRFQPTSEHVRRSESLLCKGETSLSYVDLLIRESIQVIPLEMVRIDKPAVVVVRVPETGEENRYMMTLSPIAKS